MGSKARERAKAMSLAVCIGGFSACRGCQKKSVVYETECRHVAVQVSRSRTILALRHIQATLYLIPSEIGSQCNFPGDVLSGGGGVPRERVFQQSFEFSGEVG